MISEVIFIDNIEGMRNIPDKYFDLAVDDPPYGIDEDGGKFRDRKGGNHRINKKEKWDSKIPSKEYFKELLRISKNQIIWGGNYFTEFLPVSRGWIYWDKLMGGDFSDGELAWTSFDSVLRKYTQCNKMMGKIQPAEKPIELYDWIYQTYFPKGGRVIDPHLGSGSNRIAADKTKNIDFTGFENNESNYLAQEKRFLEYKMKYSPADIHPETIHGELKLF